ncbi:hypothetical protein R1flu_019212 [Riccia fluitans]|uniref:Uncharacterized protein n=1 Tax=Riccia fluitans TaxID=41844 RepID=A0ABD1ZLH3_9MARC
MFLGSPLKCLRKQHSSLYMDVQCLKSLHNIEVTTYINISDSVFSIAGQVSQTTEVADGEVSGAQSASAMSSIILR